MPRDRYDVDPSMENDHDGSPENHSSTPEQNALHKVGPSLHHRAHLTMDPDLDAYDRGLSQENQQLVSNLDPQTQIRNAKRSLLSWRADPVSSFSDWTLQILAVRHDGTHYHTNYFCHSNVLAWGPRRGNFFVKLFEKQRRKSEVLLSRIKMEEAQAKIFPVILDFMYCGSTLPLSADRLHLLYGLAETFDIPKLKEGIQLFVQNAMDVNQLIDFLTFVSERNIGVSIQRLVLLAESKLFGILFKVPENGRLIPPSVLSQILQKRKQSINVLKKRNPAKYTQTWESERSKVIGNIIGDCCIHAVTSPTSSPLTMRTLENITNPDILPVLDGTTSLKLLQVQGILNQMPERGAGENSLKFRSRGGKLSPLEQRCILALVPEWRMLIRDDQSSVKMAIRNLTPNVLAQLLLAVSKMYEASTPVSEPMTSTSLYFDRHDLQMGDLEEDVLVPMMAP